LAALAFAVAVVYALAPVSPPASRGDAVASDPQAVAVALVAALNARNPDGAAALFADDAVVRSSRGVQAAGRAAIRAYFAEEVSRPSLRTLERLRTDGAVLRYDLAIVDLALSHVVAPPLRASYVVAVRGGRIALHAETMDAASVATREAVIQQARSGSPAVPNATRAPS
jgi:uncharacterized protein (TIGR02246 family)